MGDFLADKIIAVTGAGRGIGRAIALAAAAEGAKVVVADYGVSMAGENPDSEIAAAVVSEIEAAGGEAVAVADDVTTMAGGEHVVAAAVDRWGRIDGVVTAAGILRKRILFEMSEAEWDVVIRTHLKGHFTVWRVASEAMVKQGHGSIVGFASGGYQGLVDQPNYSAAKGGIVSLTRSAAAALRPYGVTANAIAPGALTRMSERLQGRMDIFPAEDVAPMVIYLLSDCAKHVTGQIYGVSGPRIAVWNQPVEVRAMYADQHWTPQAIAARLDSTVGQEPLAGVANWNPTDPDTAPTITPKPR